ncbi:MAG: ArsI/CadI family heavy metal resistance metalloenzyme [Acidimicrobiia bacterium]
MPTDLSADLAPDLEAPPGGRLQLALNVDDLDAAIAFYSKMFGTAPIKVKPGYANFAIAAPPLKLVLFSGAGEPGTLNHLGIEVDSADAVAAAEARLRADGLDTTDVEATNCCFAAKTETWLEAPDGQRWEWYVKHDDLGGFASDAADPASGSTCCS